MTLMVPRLLFSLATALPAPLAAQDSQDVALPIVLDFFAYVRDDERALILGAGIPESWVQRAPGVQVERLRTPFGSLNLSMQAADSTELLVRVGGDLQVPPVDGVIVQPSASGEVTVRRLPADVRVSY